MSTLTIVRRIDALPSAVFDALVEADGMSAWWGPDDGPVLEAESDPRVGGRYRVRFRMEDDSEHEAGGEYLVVDRPHRVSMTFRWSGDADDSGPSRIDVTLRPMGDATELTFVQSQLRDDATRDSHEEGWNGALDKLERRFAGSAGAS